MYLITVEGGDGSGKGEAVRILTELLAYYPFNEVHRTHEPRRHSDLGKLALRLSKSETRHHCKKLACLLLTASIIRTPGLSRT